jgi:alpha-tubulin suppressor-like RCC1 family protein
MPACGLCTIAFVAACKDEFPNASPVAISIAAATWHDTVAVRDIDTLQIRVAVVGGGDVTGVQVHWESTDPDKLEVTPLEPLVGQEQDSLMLQLRTVITAHARDSAVFVRAIVDRPGFEHAVFARQITVMERWKAVSAGYTHSCGVTIDGVGFCWGTGVLGNGSTAGSNIPVPLTGDFQLESITSGAGYACGTLVDGRVYCWGRNRYGMIGNSLPSDQLTPAPVSLGQTFESISAGATHACGVADAAGFCWGDNSTGQLGDDGRQFGKPVPAFDICFPLQPRVCSLSPRSVRDTNLIAETLTGISAAGTHTCAMTTTGGVICWGGGSAEIGSDTVARTDSMKTLEHKIVVRGGYTFTAITAGLSHNCGIRTPGSEAYCWGLDSYGQLGTRSPGSACPDGGGGLILCSTTPLRIPAGHRFLRLSAGERTTCGIDADDSTVYCWGSNQFGQIDAAHLTDTTCASGAGCRLTPTPVPVIGARRVISISVGQRHACAVTVEGAAYCWGEPAGGKLGNASTSGGTTPSLPVRVSEPH